jgi:hypothetical protein
MDAAAPLEVEKVHEKSQNLSPTQIRRLRIEFYARISTHCALLELPAELRDRIYRYSLPTKEKIDITTRFELPALLQSCRQIRSETIKMWYKKNKFLITITDCDASRLVASRRHCVMVIGAVNIDTRLRGLPDWDNLMEWCHNTHAGDSDNKNLRPGGGHGPMSFEAYLVVDTVLEIASKHSSLSWKQCKETLQALRGMAYSLNNGWKLS